MTMKVATLQETRHRHRAVPLVETTSNTLGTTVSREQLDALPVPGRTFTALAQTAPGVTGVGGGGVNAGGQLNRNNSYRIDGVSNDNNVLASPRGGLSMEAVREYIVIANQFAAEYGDASGAIVSVVTRSGTNNAAGPRLPVPSRRIARRAGSVLEGAGLGPGAVQPAARRRLPRRPDQARPDALLRHLRGRAPRSDGGHHVAARAGRSARSAEPRRRATSSSCAPTTASPPTTRCSSATASTSRSKRTAASAA